MYAGFYHLSADPFCLSPDPRFRFSHPSYNKAKAYMSYALQRAEGFVVVTGAPGTGKTTLIKEVVGTLNDTHFNIAQLVSTQLSATDLLQLIAYSFGITNEGLDKATLLRRLQLHLIQQYHKQRKTLLIVDEAQDLPQSALEELRLLTNLDYNNQPLLQVFLVGQKQLFALLQLDVMEQLRQRIVAASELKPLAKLEIERYILHRLQIAGWKQDPRLDRNLFPHLHYFSKGVPRKINQIMSRLFLHGFVEDKHILNAGDFSEVINEIKSERMSMSLLQTEDNDQPALPRDPLLAIYSNATH
jgi:type II secretory pathway predicted ATPase ExeA